MPEWSIKKELCKLANSKHLHEALVSLGLIESSSLYYEIVESGEGWERGGAETYIFKFGIKFEEKIRQFILKACVSFVPDSSPTEIIEDWVSKRELMKASGVSTPELFFCGTGVILEEYIEYTLEQCLIPDSPEIEGIIEKLAHYCGTLTQLGFLPVSLFHDLRSRGTDVVMIDFGADLGPRRVESSSHEYIGKALLKKLKGIKNLSGELVVYAHQQYKMYTQDPTNETSQ